MEDPECVRCSACVQSCPTGVLAFGRYAGEGPPGPRPPPTPPRPHERSDQARMIQAHRARTPASSTIWKNLLLFTRCRGLRRRLPVSARRPVPPCDESDCRRCSCRCRGPLAAFWLNARKPLRADGLRWPRLAARLPLPRGAVRYGFAQASSMAHGWGSWLPPRVRIGTQPDLPRRCPGQCLRVCPLQQCGRGADLPGICLCPHCRSLPPNGRRSSRPRFSRFSTSAAGIPWLNVIAGVLTSGLIFAVLFARWRSLHWRSAFTSPRMFQERLACGQAQPPCWHRRIRNQLARPPRPWRWRALRR